MIKFGDRIKTRRYLNYEESAIYAYANLIERIDNTEIKIILRGIKAEEDTHRDKIKELI